jgi:hypothetical protein
MKPEDHKAKAEQIERSLLKCLPADYEMTIEAAMLAGTHWLNYLLHQRGITSPDADVLHTYMLTVNELRRYRVADAPAIDSLAEIEDIRPGYVRGNLPDGKAAAARARDLLAVLRNSALASSAGRSLP